MYSTAPYIMNIGNSNFFKLSYFDYWSVETTDAFVYNRRHTEHPECVTLIRSTYYMMTSSNGNFFRVTDPLCGNSPVPVNYPHKSQWRGALMFSLICVWINGWVNNRETGDLRRHRGHYDVNVMIRTFMFDTMSFLIPHPKFHTWLDK